MGSENATTLQKAMKGAPLAVLDAAALHVREQITHFIHIIEDIISVTQRWAMRKAVNDLLQFDTVYMSPP